MFFFSLVCADQYYQEVVAENLYSDFFSVEVEIKTNKRRSTAIVIK